MAEILGQDALNMCKKCAESCKFTVTQKNKIAGFRECGAASQIITGRMVKLVNGEWRFIPERGDIPRLVELLSGTAVHDLSDQIRRRFDLLTKR